MSICPQTVRIVLKLESFHSCPRCPVYELSFSRTARNVIGKDSVRRLGPSGSAALRDLQIRREASADRARLVSLDWTTTSRRALDGLLSDIANVVTTRGSLEASAMNDHVANYSAQRPQRLEITLLRGVNNIEHVIFYSGPDDNGRLKQLTLKIQGLHQDRRDFDGMPAFYSDEKALINVGILWPYGEALGCKGELPDVYAILYPRWPLVVGAMASHQSNTGRTRWPEVGKYAIRLLHPTRPNRGFPRPLFRESRTI